MSSVLSDPGEGVGRGMDLGGSVGRGGVGAGVGAGVVGGSSSVWSLMVDPPLPRMVAWVPVLCRGLALFIAFPFVCLILLDIVAYLIARTLHLRPTILRVPRSPLSSLKPELVDLKSQDGVGGEGEGDGEGTEIELELDVGATESEGSPVVVLKDLGRGEEEEKQVGADERKGKQEQAGLGVILRGGGDAGVEKGEEKVLIRPSTPTHETEEEEDKHTINNDRLQKTQAVETNHINLGVPIDGHDNPPSPLPDELDIDARFGIEHKETDDMDKSCPEGLADEALGSWNPGKSSSAAKTAEGQKGGVEGDEAEDKKRGYEPVKGGEGEPSVHLGEWEPVDFAKEFAGLSGTKKGDEANTTDDPVIKDLEDRLAREDESIHKETEEVEKKVELSTDDLRKLLQEAQQHKLEGNSLFQATEPDLDGAIGAYKAALEILPTTSLTPQPKAKEPEVDGGKAKAADVATSGVVELTDEQAEAIKLAEEEREAESKRHEEEERDPVVMQKREVEREIEDTKKAVWGNLGAVWVKKGDDKEAMTACSEALKLDPTYVKVLQRRALAGERIASWSSLTTSHEDYTTLTQILPKLSPVYSQAQRALNTLPARIRTQQEKEKDEMLFKLKELGDGLLGRFGLSTNNFKFDKQEGGGYSMRFEQ